MKSFFIKEVKNWGMMKVITRLSLAACFLIASCEKDSPEYEESNLAPLSIEFDNIIGGQNLILNNGIYTNAAGEEFSVNLLQYFVSNISLTRADGTEYVVPQDSSYFLIVENNINARHAKVKVPEGEYTSLSFVLGVDSLRSTKDISERQGVLDPSGGMESGMYWGWNNGYIFFKMEGTSPQAPVDPSGQNRFRYHIGGFGGYNTATMNNIKTITIDLRPGGIPKVQAGREANIHLLVDISKVFSGTNTISLATHPTVMFSEFSVNVANNLTEMFRHDHTEN